jgi:YspA, cpYpsA-related SLOG family
MVYIHCPDVPGSPYSQRLLSLLCTGGRMARKVAISGSRNYKQSWLVQQCITTEYRKYDGDIQFLVGDCPTGVDRIAKSFLETAGWDFKEFFADWEKYGNKAGPYRNMDMIDYGAGLLIAFPENGSKGTKQCASYAKSLNIPVYFPEIEDWHRWAVPMAMLRN